MATPPAFGARLVVLGMIARSRTRALWLEGFGVQKENMGVFSIS